ncbi:ATP-dependent nuclease [Methanobacterium oryzae]|uniref:ATP-dependent nuclease n=1 Tax=Methanobacterium oryzae TaxID=69540 RepID=UPI003D1D6342
MKIDSITIKNVKSFRNEISINFKKDFNILVGPNGGGKSNLLDIINIIFKNFLLNSYKAEPESRGNDYYNVITTNNSDKLRDNLDKFMGDESDSFIKLTLEITAQDVENMKTIQNHQQDFEDEISKYHNNPIPDFNYFRMLFDINELKGKKVTYIIQNNSFQEPISSNANAYLQYLQNFDLFVLLAKKMDNINLNSICLYFSPYRGGEQPSQINLSDNFYNYLVGYLGATSKRNTSLIQLATHHFAEKMLEYGYNAKDKGYWEDWKKDRGVKRIDERLSELGYSWEIKRLSSTLYKIIIIQNSRQFYIEQASSGEKELINFLFGIFTFNIENGLIIIDEPELHLHPKWQSALLDLFINLSEETGNQFILSTHSPSFINNKTISNVIRIYMDENSSNKVEIDESKFANAKDLLHMINSQNNEKMFFADKVVLVEGIHDRLIFEKLIENKSENNEVIEVLDVGGKSNLQKYRDFLENIKVKNFIIADLDYLSDIGDENIKKIFKTNYKKIEEEVINKKTSKDGKRLAEKIEDAINENNISKLTEIWEYIKSRNRRISDTIDDNGKKLIYEYINHIRSKRIFILKEGELEDYLPEGYKSKDLEKIIELTKNHNFSKWWNKIKDNELGDEINSIVTDIINK